MSYHDELRWAMQMLAEHPKAIFLGQGVGVPGTSMHSTLSDIPREKRLEMPVAEELQMGMAIGMALEGYLPICIFPRWNFVLRAADQLINHLDRLPIYSGGDYEPKVLIRTAVPSTAPFNPQAQHDDDFSGPFDDMLRTITVQRLRSADSIIPAYRAAAHANNTRSTILVEYTDYYKDERGKDQRAA